MKLIPVLLLFDFAAAFPSVKHRWLWLVAKGIGMPKGLLTALKRMYSGNDAYYKCDGELQWLFLVISGVLQGCPLSGSLFVLSIDPLLYIFKTRIEDAALGCVKACADDIGASLRALYHLPILDRAFHEFKSISGLVLKPKKCVMILTTITASDSNIQVIRNWLAANCPRWASFQISNVGKYLGFQMGPLGGEAQWKEPIDKFKERVREIKAEGLPLGLAASRLAVRAIPVLGYKAQICSLPPYFSQVELWAAHKLLGIPLSLDLNAAFGLGMMGGPKIVRATHYMRASMLRSASKTIGGYAEMHDKLTNAATDGASLACYARHDIRPPGWQSQAFVSNLTWATTGRGLGLDEHAAAIERAFSDIKSGVGRKPRQSQQGAFYAYLQTLTPPDWALSRGNLRSLTALTGLPRFPLRTSTYCRLLSKR